MAYRSSSVGFLAIMMLTPALAQLDITFPNVSANFNHSWPCMDPGSGLYYMPENYIYSAQPTTEFAGMNWGSLNGDPLDLAVEGDKIYFYTTNDHYINLYGSNIIQLYDFSLVVGDTAYINYYYADNGVPAIITSVDTIMIEGRSRKRSHIDMDGWYGDIWIQGLGSIQGLFRPMWTTPLGCGDPNYTFCANYVDQDGIPYTWCNDIVMNNRETAITPLRVFPNPANGEVTVELDLDHVAKRPYTITDATGRMILHGWMDGSRSSIDIRTAGSGLFFLRVADQVVKLVNK